jgi:hypothetical protein
LHLVAGLPRQERELFLGLDAFGDDREIEPAANPPVSNSYSLRGIVIRI